MHYQFVAERQAGSQQRGLDMMLGLYASVSDNLLEVQGQVDKPALIEKSRTYIAKTAMIIDSILACPIISTA